MEKAYRPFLQHWENEGRILRPAPGEVPGHLPRCSYLINFCDCGGTTIPGTDEASVVAREEAVGRLRPVWWILRFYHGPIALIDLLEPILKRLHQAHDSGGYLAALQAATEAVETILDTQPSRG